MQSAITLLWRTAVLLLFLAGGTAAQQDINRQLLESNDPFYSYTGADAVIIYDSTDVEVFESGLSYVNIHSLIKIQTPEGAADYRQVLFNYDPLSAHYEIKAAKIYHADGTVETLDTTRILDNPAYARAIYWGARDVTVNFGRLQPGDAVELVVFKKGFTYALLRDDDDRFIPPMKGHYYDIVDFWSDIPVGIKVYRIALPVDKKLQYQFFNGRAESYLHFAPEKDTTINVDVNPRQKQTNHPDSFTEYPDPYNMEKNIYCWVKREIEPFERESDMVAVSDVAPKLLMSTSPDWYAKAVWFYNVNEDYGSFETTPEITKKTMELIEDADDDYEKISILTHWVAENIRYSGLSMGEGEGYTLHTGKMTFHDRCGVCKDKAGMLIAMLRVAGFESYAAMTMAGSRIEDIPADQFNHSVTVVKLDDGDWMLLDPTWVPGVRELWSSAEQQQQYLMGIPGGSDLKTTPISPAENHYWRMNAESELAADGTLRGTLELTAEGQSDALIRRVYQRSFASASEEFMPLVFKKISPNAEIIRQEVQDPYDISKPMRIFIEFKIPGYAEVTDDHIIFTPITAMNIFSDEYYFSPELRVNTDLEERKYGFRIRCSKLVEMKENVELPSEFEVQEMPEFETVDHKAAVFSSAYSDYGDEINFSLKHVMEKRLYEKEDWKPFRKALLERKKAMDTPVILRREK